MPAGPLRYPSSGDDSLRCLKRAQRWEARWRGLQRLAREKPRDGGEGGVDRVRIGIAGGGVASEDFLGRRASLHPHARDEERHIQPRRADPGVRPVDDQHSLVGDEQIVGPQIEMEQRVAGNRLRSTQLPAPSTTRGYAAPSHPARLGARTRSAATSRSGRCPSFSVVPANALSSGDGVSASDRPTIASTTRSSSSVVHGGQARVPRHPRTPALPSRRRLRRATTAVAGRVRHLAAPQRYCLTPMKLRRLRVRCRTHCLAEDTLPVRGRQPGGNTGRKSTGLRPRRNDAAAQPTIDGSAQMVRQVRPLEPNACCRRGRITSLRSVVTHRVLPF